MPQRATGLDHVSFHVPPSRYEEVVKWYTAALAPIGYSKQLDFGVACGFGIDKASADFWIGSKEGPEISGLHIAFKATDHETVDKFHAEAIKAGGTCNGKPGIREMYHPNYYGAFVFDPMGNNIEVVDHQAH
ncbi:Glyoxalase/Bleomycin resistance protein/Dihydroxybiphenyl dioxygenase [Aaosphaeria arxii CBS 175.79]|uniref:Glyoxalase/Bleomycin resistance protein/Dihydroxybiphenyl dioxygenase n=1 Tax=Aaosphaeria arxii CBS 175.79 TaxID=1450172 RepID=A0A6A5XCD7_9PLEO|nr:Glyoxalase/Bleomycin resistance protein/Dihydroxybiphenyl dioxygenase [Aaosphaeria arxii CBS 175.79]KAF2010486.1 Glyoxalase/Bleomycin resistance protein/Dihydroxybiphenyl dioxygenase [Aaosphaeria arxii CBS 175.79]